MTSHAVNERDYYSLNNFELKINMFLKTITCLYNIVRMYVEVFVEWGGGRRVAIKLSHGEKKSLPLGGNSSKNSLHIDTYWDGNFPEWEQASVCSCPAPPPPPHRCGCPRLLS